MNGIVINVDPVALHLGTFEIRWYAIAILLAVIAAVLISVREGVRKGLKREHIYGLLPWVMGVGIVGARLFHVVDRWADYRGNPALIFNIQQGGLAIWGAVIGGFIAVIIYARLNKINTWKLLDVLVPGLIVAQIIGRVGCIINGDAYGGAANLPWSFIYTNPNSLIPAYLNGVPTQPYPLYEMLWNAASLALLLRLRPRFNRDGMLFLGYLGLYSVGRFILTFVRQEKVWFWGLQEAQVLSILIVITTIVAWWWVTRKRFVQKISTADAVTDR